MKSLTNLTDQQLVHLYTDGNTKALEVLINRYKDKIYTSIFLLVKDRYLADDFFQDVFIRVIDALKMGRYTDEGKFLPWILRIAHNICMDHFKKIKSIPPIRTSDDHDIFEVLNFSEENAEQCIIRKQSNDHLCKMIDHLPLEQREVIVMRHYAGLSFKEIGDLTKCNINSTLSRMRYGLVNLRKMMIEKQMAI